MQAMVEGQCPDLQPPPNHLEENANMPIDPPGCEPIPAEAPTLLATAPPLPGATARAPRVITARHEPPPRPTSPSLPSDVPETFGIVHYTSTAAYHQYDYRLCIHFYKLIRSHLSPDGTTYTNLKLIKTSFHIEITTDEDINVHIFIQDGNSSESKIRSVRNL